MSHKLVRLAACGLFFGVVLSGVASAAPTAQQIADALAAAMDATGESKVTYQGVAGSGDDVTLSGFVMTDPDGNTVTIPALVISGAAERETGGFTAARITFDGGSGKSENDTITWQTGSLENATVPSAEEVKARAKIRPFTRFQVGTINVTSTEMAAPVDIATVSVEVGEVVDGALSDLVLKTDGVRIPGALITDEQQKALIQALGYSDFLVNLTVDGSFDSVADILTVRRINIDTADVGTLAITGRFSGVSLGGMATSDQAKAAEAQSKARLDNVTVRFDNGGVVERALDMQAEMIGGTRDEVVVQLSGALPFLLNIIGNPAFQQKLATAGAAFLASPGSLTVEMTPTEPVTFEEITKAVADDPGALPDMLVIEVTANRPAN
jgi:hypothetical protein